MFKTTLGLITIIIQIELIMGKHFDQILAMNNLAFGLYNRFLEEHNTTNSMYFPICPWDLLLQNSMLLSVLNETGLKLSNIEDTLMSESLGLYKWESDIFLDPDRLNLRLWRINGLDVQKNLIDRWIHGKIKNFQYSKLQDVNFLSINNQFRRKFNITSNIIEPDELTGETQGVIVSWMSFYNSWKYSFTEDSKITEVFNSHNGNAILIPMMTNNEAYRWGHFESLSAKFIVLPFKDERVNMFVIVPYENVKLEEIEKRIADINLSELLLKRPKSINLYLPKFQLKTSHNFYRSELLGKTTQTQPIRYNKIIHKTFISSSAFESETNSPGESVDRAMDTFVVDRPFLVLIVKKSMGKNLVMFYARVDNPIE